MCEAFQVAELALMLRATRADQEDLIICIAIWTLYKLCGPLISDEPRVVSIASQNELRFTSLLGGIFMVLGLILGGFGEATWKPKSIFWMFFFDVFFECVLGSIWMDFWRLET